MSKDLKIKASRLITVNKTGNVETQFYSTYPTDFTPEINQLIVNSDNPFEEWCKYIPPAALGIGLNLEYKN